MSSNISETGSEDLSLYGSESEQEADVTKLSLRIFDNDENSTQIFHPIFKLINADFNFLKIQKLEADDQTSDESNDFNSVAILIFLHEEGMLECEKIQSARQNFENPPWTFHHSEEMNILKITPYPYNSQEFYSMSPDLPLWAVRQVHYGKEHLRVMLFVSNTTWYDMLGFYKIILGMEPDVQRHDFCLYTLTDHDNYDIQFALKRLPETLRPKPLNRVRIVFYVSEIGQMVPLLPSSCEPITDTEWLTKDHDGNQVILNTESDKPTSSPFVRNGPMTKTMLNGFYV